MASLLLEPGLKEDHWSWGLCLQAWLMVKSPHKSILCQTSFLKKVTKCGSGIVNKIAAETRLSHLSYQGLLLISCEEHFRIREQQQRNMRYSDFLRQLETKEQKANQSSCLDSLKIHTESRLWCYTICDRC